VIKAIFKIAGGVLAILIGVGTAADPESEHIWTGGIIVGVLLVLSGLKDIVRDRKGKRHQERMGACYEELEARLRQKEPIDRIAAAFYSDYGIPPTRTLLTGCSLMSSWLTAESPDQRRVANELLALQDVDGNTPPDAYLEKLGFERTVFLADENTKAHTSHPREKKPSEGVLILSKAYLYFIEAEKEGVLRQMGDRLMDKAGEFIPFVGLATGAYSLMSGMSKELADYFSPSRVKKLKEHFHRHHSFAIRLADIVELKEETVKWTMSTSRYLEVRTGRRGAPAATFWLETKSVNEEKWIREWTEVVRLACLGEGCIVNASGAPSAIAGRS